MLHIGVFGNNLVVECISQSLMDGVWVENHAKGIDEGIEFMLGKVLTDGIRKA